MPGGTNIGKQNSGFDSLDRDYHWRMYLHSWKSLSNMDPPSNTKNRPSCNNNETDPSAAQPQGVPHPVTSTEQP